MNKLDFAAINAALDAGTLVPQWLPDGKKRGAEWVALNPIRGDKTAGSFTINLVKGVWKDYASGDAGSDLVSLYAYLFHDNDQGAAAKELADERGMVFTPATRAAAATNVTKIEDAKPTPVIPVPAEAGPATFEHHDYGQPNATWEYRDAEGRTMMYVCRFDPEGERKQIQPRSWCTHPGKPSRWTWRGITGAGKRPLYGLDRLADMPDADVILVEGEKAADAGQQLMAEAAVVVSWMGGVDTADKVNVKPLAGRRVILFPDHDALRVKLTKAEQDAGADPEDQPLLPFHEQPGIRAMMALAASLKGVAREVVMVGYTPVRESHGWDLADAQDAGWDGAKVLRYIGKNAGDPMHIIKGPQKPPPAEAANDNLPLDAAVNPFGYLHLSDKGQPMNTVENLEYLLNEYGISAKYNQVRKGVEVVVPGRSYTLDNRANCSLSELTSICARNRMPASNLAEYVKLISDRNAYNPACDWITSKAWDGRQRVQQLLDTVTTTGEVWLKDALMRRWLLSAVAAVFQPTGFEGHGCLVFTGAQGVGKTTWFRRLVPGDLKLVLVGAMLDPADKDSVTNVVSHWIVELGELDATFRKADIARLKSFIPKAEDKLRRPYDRIDSEYQRRTVFCASVNDDRYLVDDTGNRRWWTVPVASIDYQHDIDMQQVWAELLVQFLDGEQYHLTIEENTALGALNAEHEAVDPVEEMIVAGFKWAEDVRPLRMTATDVLVAVGYDKPNKAQATHASKVLKKLTGGEPKKSGASRFFDMPAKLRGTRSLPLPDDEFKPF